MNEKKLLFRMIVPHFSEVNVFSFIAKRTTALGPVMIAAVAEKLLNWRVEIIDENNYYKGPLGSHGLPDHEILQKENPADVVGIFCSLSSTMERAWDIANFYRDHGATVIAGGWHAHYLPEESLKKGFNIVVHGEGEDIINSLLEAIANKDPLSEIPGISYWQDWQIKTNSPEKNEVCNLNTLPFPNFGLIRFAKIGIYPIGRVRGCSQGCEFCSVRGKPHWVESQYLFEQVKWLVKTRRARKFFLVDDNSKENRQGALDFFGKISEKYGSSLDFAVQLRLETAKDEELLTAMKKAGVRSVCIGYESPIDEELKTMHKGYLSKDMAKWTKIFHNHGFFIHGMFIFGYPDPNGKKISVTISAKERSKRYKNFIRQCRIDTIQILRPVPLPGTEFRKRLETEGKLFPLSVVPWSKYDGSYVCFQPDNMTVEELQELPLKLMGWHYKMRSLIGVVLRILIFPADYFLRGRKKWYHGWRNDIVRSGGHLIIKKWKKNSEKQIFLQSLENFLAKKK